MPDAVIILDRKGTFLDVSDEAEKISGYKKEELIGKNLLMTKILDTKAKAIVMRRLALHFSGEKLPPFEIEIHSKDGRIIPLEINPQIIDYMGKKADMIVIRDITGRKEMENNLRESEERHRFLVDNIEEIVLIISKTGSILFANKKTLKIFGYSLEEIKEKSIVSFLTKNSVAKALYALAQEFLGKPQPEMELEAKTKSGETRILRVAPSSIPVYEKGKMIGIQVNCSDVTDNKKMEEERKKAEEALKKRTEELEKFSNMSVGRELKMVELKKRIRDLEDLLRKHGINEEPKREILQEET